ncbi:MAG TPA: SPOR domain-containing protein, partial [Lysobacter sp.]|nr:SPOR domain-containing protein [Lysobacter sp.]
MEPALKQRLIGAAVLLALAVIFLPMLIKGPAPESGVSDVSLDMPDSPDGAYETRELPLVSPGSAPSGGALGMDAPVGAGAKLPTVDTSAGDPAAEGDDAMMPPPTAGGDYAVSFGSYASAADAQRVVGALRASQLPGYQDSVAGSDGRTLYRVRVGPYASQAEAEAARLRAAHVRDDVGSKVVVLDAEPTAASTATEPAAVAPAKPPVARPEPPAAPKPAATTAPAAAPVAAPAPTPAPRPAAADVGF